MSPIFAILAAMATVLVVIIGLVCIGIGVAVKAAIGGKKRRRR